MLSQPLQLTSREQNQLPHASSKIDVEVNLFTLGEIEIERSNRATREAVSAGILHETNRVSYVLFLDSKGQVVDGTWKKNPDSKKGVDFAWFGAGKGTDADYADLADKTGNPFLEFDVVKKLVQLSARSKKITSARTCKAAVGSQD